MEHLEHASNVDLLSTLAGKPAAEVLMEEYGELTKLAQVSFNDLQQVKGVGKSRAAAIKSAFLLAQRLSHETIVEPPLCDSPERVADLLRERNRLYTVEVLQTVLVNTRRRLIAVQNISQGTLDTILVHPREVFSAAIAHRAAGIVLAHNHPSGVIPHPVLCRMARDFPYVH
jgi:DNA repair protein RadC